MNSRLQGLYDAEMREQSLEATGKIMPALVIGSNTGSR